MLGRLEGGHPDAGIMVTAFLSPSFLISPIDASQLRTIHDVFEALNGCGGSQYGCPESWQVTVSYVEIYNEVAEMMHGDAALTRVVITGGARSAEQWATWGMLPHTSKFSQHTLSLIHI